MIDLSRKLDDTLSIDGVEYPLDLSFGNVLRLFEMLHSDDIPIYVQPHFALRILLKDEDHGKELLDSIDIDTALVIYKSIADEHIKVKDAKTEAPVYDLAGNLITRKKRTDDADDDEEERKPLFSLKYDGDYIYASFLQAYGIDLIDNQNTLHWQKFHALLNGLPNNTKFAEVLKIRSWEESSSDSPEYKEKMRKLQDEYALPENIDY